jgi:hypothetical protein
MPSIVSQTQSDSPVRIILQHHSDDDRMIPDDNLIGIKNPSSSIVHSVNELTIPADNLTQLDVLEGIEYSPSSVPTSAVLPFLTWKTTAKNPKSLNVSRPSRYYKRSSQNKSSSSSSKKVRKFISANAGSVDNDPASALLAKRLHHEELMQLHAHFKKKSIPDKLLPLSKQTYLTHGLAPFGKTIPKEGQAYVVGSDCCAKQPLQESNLEMFNQFKEK